MEMGGPTELGGGTWGPRQYRKTGAIHFYSTHRGSYYYSMMQQPPQRYGPFEMGRGGANPPLALNSLYLKFYVLINIYFSLKRYSNSNNCLKY